MTVLQNPAKSTGIGAPVKRVEDYRFLTGRGRYTDDMNKQGQLYAYILRSPHAHARILSIDTTEAEQAPGVHAVITGAEMKAAGIGSIDLRKSAIGSMCSWRSSTPHFTADS